VDWLAARGWGCLKRGLPEPDFGPKSPPFIYLVKSRCRSSYDMKPLCVAVALVLLTAGCASTPSPANDQTVRPGPADSDTYILHSPERTAPGYADSRPPRLTVGVSDPDTQLILPWFLNDIINFVNYR
jgi:hypothetical protein